MLSNIGLSNNRNQQKQNQWEFEAHKIFSLMIASVSHSSLVSVKYLPPLDDIEVSCEGSKPLF